MFAPHSRRRFLQATTGAAAAAAWPSLGLLSGLPRVSADEATPNPGKVVALAPEIEPLVRLLEDTPRERLLEAVADRIRRGTTYTEVVAALLLAGVRNVEPRPSVGFKFHAVLVVNSAHLASMASPEEHRWLPIFWALDYFKTAQARDVQEGNWTMAPVDDAALPPPHRARAEFVDAMEKWDVERADRAVAQLARTAGAADVFEIFFRLGSRDYRSIGHKAIYVANAWRTLQCIGWRHAEPVLRSLAYALLNHSGEANPAQSDHAADRPWRENQARAKAIRAQWLDGKVDSGATSELLQTLYSGNSAEVCDQVVEMLNRGVGPQSIWDALLVGSGELLMRQPGIVGLHTLTTSNAIRYAFEAAGDDETRKLLLLQNAAFLPMFRQGMRGRGGVADARLTELEPAEMQGDDPLAQVFDAVGRDRQRAARLTLAYAQAHPAPGDFIDRARLLVFFKGRDSHDYKFSSAVLEDYLHISPGWRERFLAASVFNLRGSSERDNPLVDRTRQALAQQVG